MKHINKRIFLFLFSFFCVLSSFSQGAPLKPVKNTIVMIADGWSINHIMAANFYEGKTEQIYQSDAFDFSAFMSTFLSGGSYNSASAWSDQNYVKDWNLNSITDSAAAGTALATGEKTYDGSINIKDTPAKNVHLKTSSQWAEESGRSIGIVSSAAFSDATPATFGGAHNISRNNNKDIARDMLFNTKLSVILSPGNPDYDYFGNPGVSDGNYMGGYDLWTDIKNNDYSLTSFGGQTVKDVNGDGVIDPWTVIHTKADFLKVANGELLPERLLGIADARFVLQPVQTYGGMNTFDNPISLDKVPTLVEMSTAALNVLNQNCKGFYLMIEGSNVDKASHSNHIRDMIREMGDFNRTVENVIEWVEANSSWDETLLIVTGDHECGYLTGPAGPIAGDLLIEDKGKGNEPDHRWSFENHTNQLVPIYAKGANAERLADYCTRTDDKRGRYLDNTDLSKLINATFDIAPEPVELSFRFARQSEPVNSADWYLEPYAIRIAEGTSSIDLQYGDLLHTSKYKITSTHTPVQMIDLPATGETALGVGVKSFTLENLEALSTGENTFTMELISDCYTDVKTFTIKVVPENVMWTGADDSNWFDDQNWVAVTTAGGLTVDASKTAYFPLASTNVTIQGKVDLSADNVIIATDDDISTANAECNEIHFIQDASMGNVQKLSYKKAFLDYKFEKDRWQLFSVPLRNMYSGDFYFDFRPKTHYRTLNVVSPEKNPQYKGNEEIAMNIGEWTKPFSNLSVPFNPESSGWLSGALAVFITDEYFTTPYGDLSDGIIVGNAMTLKYPRLDESNKLMNYYWVDPVNLNPDVVPAEISSRFSPVRGDDAYRFIFEDGTGKARTDLKIAQGIAGNYALVGNPFMGHLNFNTLYSLTTAIDNEYKIFDGTSYITWKNDDSSEGLDGMIAPLQGFIVPLIGSEDETVTVSINPLADNLVGTGASVLRSSPQNSNRLRMSVTHGTKTSSILIKGTDSGNDEYNPREDAEKLFFDSGFHLDLFSISDSKALEINVLNNESLNTTYTMIPLGLRTTSDGDATFHIEGIESFNREDIYLIDKYERMEILLNESDSYLFSLPLSGNITDVDRFELRFGNPPTGIDNITENQLWIGSDKNQITVRSTSKDPIQMIFVYDLNGNIIKKIERPEDSYCNFTLNTKNQIVLLKAITRKTVKTQKISLHL